MNKGMRHDGTSRTEPSEKVPREPRGGDEFGAAENTSLDEGLAEAHFARTFIHLTFD